VNNLLAILGVTKQSLNRVLRTLIADGLVESRVGTIDKRERHLFLTQAGRELETRLSDAQRARMRAAFRDAGPEAVAGFKQVLAQAVHALDESRTDTGMEAASSGIRSVMHHTFGCVPVRDNHH